LIFARTKTRRNQRAEMIGERLEKAHIPGALEGAQKLANGGAVTRGHFARFLVAGKATTWRMSLKSIWRAGKPDTFRHSGVQ
jgi:predicted metal-dependent phosphoesterase TrpH